MLDWIFHRAELLTTFDEKRYRSVMSKLNMANIPFRTKRFSPADPGRPEPVGELPDRSTQYYIYVRDRDLEEAEYLLRDVRN